MFTCSFSLCVDSVRVSPGTGWDVLPHLVNYPSHLVVVLTPSLGLKLFGFLGYPDLIPLILHFAFMGPAFLPLVPETDSLPCLGGEIR